MIVVVPGSAPPCRATIATVLPWPLSATDAPCGPPTGRYDTVLPAPFSVIDPPACRSAVMEFPLPFTVTQRQELRKLMLSRLPWMTASPPAQSALTLAVLCETVTPWACAG